MTDSKRTNLTNISHTDEKLSFSSSFNMLFALKVAEYLFLAAFIYTIGVTKLFPDIEIAKICTVAFISIWFFLLMLNQQLLKSYNQPNLTQKAELYNYLSASHNFAENNPLTPAREKALQYCHELIEDYKKIRSSSRTIYYTLQLATVIFSGITPILVLVDKLDIGISWFKWLPVIFPAVASIVASIVTSFPFQENSVAANTTVELLEAEQEKFILGVTDSYRCYDLENETQRQLKAKQAIENFITQVNNIHLNQVQASVQTLPSLEKTATSQSVESNEGTLGAR